MQVSRQSPERAALIGVGFCCLAAIALRVAYAVHMGADDFWSHGYFYYEIAQNIAAGKGILRTEGNMTGWAIRPPLYPIFLTPAALWGGNYLLIVVPQALLGAGTVVCAFLIGRLLFGTRVGVIAAALTAIYPFYVVHDTALQETGMQTFLAALSVYLLLRARKEQSRSLWLAAGMLLGLCVLTRGMMLPFALCALAWIGCLGIGPAREKNHPLYPGLSGLRGHPRRLAGAERDAAGPPGPQQRVRPAFLGGAQSGNLQPLSHR